MKDNECNHGDLCSCRVLAAAIGVSPDCCSFNYCRKVLQKRWIMQCNHGNVGGLKEALEPVYEPVIFPNGSIEVVKKGNE